MNMYRQDKRLYILSFLLLKAHTREQGGSVDE